MSPIPDYKRRGQALIGDPGNLRGSRVFAFFIREENDTGSPIAGSGMTDKSKDKDSETLDSCFPPSVILDALSPIPDYKRRGQALIGDPVKERIQGSNLSFPTFLIGNPGFFLLSFVRRTTLDPRSGSGMTDKSKENDTGFISTLDPRLLTSGTSLRE